MRTHKIYSGDDYRPDIDGLRAIAVLSVIAYHAWPAVLPGGYMGVDIFFVISGFIITTFILRRLQAGSFSLVEFYARRMKRILPVLFVVMAVTFVACYLVFLPGDMGEFGESMAATTLFVANLHFYGEAGYFDAPSFEKPLLHMWSLGVEEQFYMVWPLLLVPLWHRLHQGGLLSVVLILIGLSYAAMYYLLVSDPEAAFFLPHSRAWQLLAGALLALTASHIKPGKWLQQAIALAAVMVLAFVLASPGHDTGIQQLYLTMLVLATGALLITRADVAFANSLLAKRPLVLIGQMSFSLYLWHWPILSLGRYTKYGQPSDVALLLSILATFVASYISWRWVELPFRSAPVATPGNRRTILLGGAMGSVLVCVIGVAVYLSGGFAWRVPGHVLALENYAAEEPATRAYCHLWDRSLPDEPRCDFGTRFAEHTQLLLIGDSHADHYAPAFQTLADELGFRGRVMTGSSCLPLFELFYVTKERTRTNCEHYRDDMLRYIERLPGPAVVVLAGRWTTYIRGPINQIPGADGFLAFGADDAVSEDHSLRVFATLLRRTVARLTGMGHSVVIMGQPPEFTREPLICVARQWMVDGDVEQVCGVSRQAVRDYLSPVNETAKDVAAAFDSVQFIDPLPVFCSSQKCSPAIGQLLAFRDTDHLNPRGADEVGKFLRPYLAGRFNIDSRLRQ